MPDVSITDEDRKKAQTCANCPVCRRARKNQRGFFYWFVKRVEGGICPACRAYEKVYERKAHEPEPEQAD
jgi:Zn ribbon nucleic-acid-binding protein